MSNDKLKTVSSVAALFDLMLDKSKPEDREASVKYRKRYFETIPGITFPDDWDQLSLEEKEERLDKAQAFGLDKDQK